MGRRTIYSDTSDFFDAALSLSDKLQTIERNSEQKIESPVENVMITAETNDGREISITIEKIPVSALMDPFELQAYINENYGIDIDPEDWNEVSIVIPEFEFEYEDL
jgi:hypothetical protein